jgi:hypothetical protein
LAAAVGQQVELAFADRGWIDSPGIVTGLDQKLNAAWAVREQGSVKRQQKARLVSAGRA